MHADRGPIAMLFFVEASVHGSKDMERSSVVLSAAQ
jgi:hypothetical protein